MRKDGQEALVRTSAEPLLLGAATGSVASLAAVLLAVACGGRTAPHIVLLAAWYGYMSV